MNWIVVDSFASELYANIGKSKLEAFGIKCRTRPNRMGDVLLGAFGMRTGPCDLLVLEEYVKKASDLLKINQEK